MTCGSSRASGPGPWTPGTEVIRRVSLPRVNSWVCQAARSDVPVNPRSARHFAASGVVTTGVSLGSDLVAMRSQWSPCMCDSRIAVERRQLGRLQRRLGQPLGAQPVAQAGPLPAVQEVRVGEQGERPIRSSIVALPPKVIVTSSPVSAMRARVPAVAGW